MLDLDTVAEDDTILAYERNDHPLEVHLGAPLRLRVEVEPWVQDGQVDQVHRVDHRLRRVR